VAKEQVVRRLQKIVRAARKQADSKDRRDFASDEVTPVSENESARGNDATSVSENESARGIDGAPVSTTPNNAADDVQKIADDLDTPIADLDSDKMTGPIVLPDLEVEPYSADAEFYVNTDIQISAEAGAVWNQAIELARKVSGLEGPKWVLVEAICAEYLSYALPLLHKDRAQQIVDMIEDEVAARGKAAEKHRRIIKERDELKASLEKMFDDWDFLPSKAPEIVPPHWAAELPDDPHAIHAQLTRLLEVRQRQDWSLGRLGRIFSLLGGWRRAGFASLGHYATERLGLNAATFMEHVRLDRKLQWYPEQLSDAYRDGLISFEKLRLLIKLRLDEQTTMKWFDYARHVTVRRLKSEVAKALDIVAANPCAIPLPQDFEMCAAEGHIPTSPSPPKSRMCAEDDVGGSDAESADVGMCAGDDPEMVGFPAQPIRHIKFRGPASVKGMLDASIMAAILLRNGQADESQAIKDIADYFIGVWSQVPPWDEETVAKRVVARDDYRCTVPGCTARANLQSHHIIFRGKGGSDEPENQTCLCMKHHLFGVHQGYLRISGSAPDGITWILGSGTGHPPVAIYQGDHKVVA